MNKDNAAAANAGPSAACDRALDISTSGAICITTLACMIFNHKDDKKGQQDSFRIFFELRLGYMIKFPDTSNTWFQSHCMAATILILYLPYFLKFLLLVRDKKENQSFIVLQGLVTRTGKRPRLNRTATNRTGPSVPVLPVIASVRFSVC
jgi:hypothetical protein